MFASDMARRRGQRTGHLIKKGPSWLLRWREDVIDETGQLKRHQFARVIARAEGPGRLTRKEAERLAYEEILAKLDQAALHPQSLMSIDAFIREKFEPEWVWSLKPSGKKHYRVQLVHVRRAFSTYRCVKEDSPHCSRGFDLLIGTGKQRGKESCPNCGAEVELATSKKLCEVDTADIQAAVRQLVDKGYSTQSVLHFRNAVSAVFHHAIAVGWFHSNNPAAAVRLPKITRKEKRALTVEEAIRLLAELPAEIRLMVLLGTNLSLNAAELLGLQWQHLNLTPHFQIVEGDALGPFSIAIRRNCYEGELTSLKTTSRWRNVPLSEELAFLLSAHHEAARFGAPTDPVFANRVGKPLCEHNLRARVLRPAGERAGISFAVGWHVFRHTCATLAEHIGMIGSDRKAILGHASDRMAMHYTHSDAERRRKSIGEISRLLMGAERLQTQ